MARDLSQIRQQLEMIAKAARAANIDLTQLNATLASLIRQNVTGGIGTEAGIQGQVNKLLSGQFVNRGRVESGRISGSKEYITQLSLALDEFIKAQVGPLTSMLSKQGAFDPRITAAISDLQEARKRLTDQALAELTNITKAYESSVAKSGATPYQHVLEKYPQLPAKTGGTLDKEALDAQEKISTDFELMYRKLWLSAEDVIRRDTQKVANSGGQSAYKYLTDLGTWTEQLYATAGGKTTPFYASGKYGYEGLPISTTGDVLDWGTIEKISNKNGQVLWEKTVASYNEQAERASTRSAPRPETTTAGVDTTSGGVSRYYVMQQKLMKALTIPAIEQIETGKSGLTDYAGVDKILETIRKYNREVAREKATSIASTKQEINAFTGIRSIEQLDSGFKKAVLRVQELGDSTKRAGKTAEESAGKFKNLVFYVDQLGEVLTPEEYSKRRREQIRGKKESLPVSEADLYSAIGRERAEAAYREVEKIKNSAGESVFGKQNLKSVRIDQPANVAELVFETKNLNGVTEKATVVVDQWGHALTRTNRRLLSFTQSIIKNTREVLTWSFGVGLVYGAYGKLGELIDKAIQNQSKLADVSIALGNAQRYVNDVFTDAQEIANATGESVDTVIDAYASAYRAVGAIEEPTKRVSAANKLLADATVLNKLSSLDSAEAIDVLSGSLRQAEGYLLAEDKATQEFGNSMKSGTYLLDRWVKLTKVANVDMATLATAFSVTAESALNAGVSVEELNAIIASLSEKIGGLGGKETGNAVRALIGGVYQEQAATALNQYGIAVQDTEGKMRNFLDISRDIYELYKQGIIDTTQLNKLGYTLGGGVRRGQQYVAFLSDYERIQKLTTEQENANGQAAQALSIKLDTLETSSTRLGNSFQGLAQELGTDGGILDLMTGLNTVGAGVIDLFASLTDLLGAMTIPATLLTVLGLMNRIGDDPMKARIASMLKRPEQAMSGWMTTQLGGRTNIPMPIVEDVSKGFGKLAPGLLMGLLPALTKASEGKWEDAGVIMAGSVAGGLVGSLGGPAGAYIGATIGGFIAQTLVEDIQDYEAEFSRIFAAAFPEEPGAVGAQSTYSKRDQLVKEITDEIINSQGGIGIVNFQGWLHNALAPLVGAKEMTPEEFMLDYVKREFPAVYQEYLDKIKEAGQYVSKDIALEDTTFYIEQERLSKEVVEADQTRVQYINELADAYRKELYESYKTGKTTAKDYRQGLQQSFALAPSTLRVGTALSIGGMSRDWEELSKIMQKASAEDSAIISALTGDVEDLSEIIDKTAGRAEALENYRGIMIDNATATQLFDQAVNALNDQLNLSVQLAQEVSAAQVKLKPTLALENQRANIDRIMEMAKQLQSREFATQLEQGGFLSEQQMNDYLAQAQPILIDFGDMMAYYIATGITDSKYIQQALEELGLAEMSNLGYQFMDITQSQMNAIMPQYNAIRQSILSAGGTSEESPLLTFFQDSANPLLMTKDWKIVQYLLQEILKTEEKQLDGMYNLPSGASFYVPFQAWAMDKETRQASAEGATGPVALDSTQFDTSTADFASSVQAFGKAVGEFLQPSFAFPGAAGKLSGKEGVIDYQPNIAKLFPSGETWSGFLQRISDQIVELTTKTDTVFDQKFSAQKGVTTPTTPPAMVDETGRPVYTGPRGATGGEIQSGYVQNPLELLISKIDQLITSNIPQISPEVESLLGPTGGIDFSSTLITPLIDALTRGLSQFFGGSFGTFGEPQAPSTAPSTIPDIQTNLKVELSSQTQLIVDGRVLADVVKPYLYNDLVTYQQSAGTTGTAFVAA